MLNPCRAVGWSVWCCIWLRFRRWENRSAASRRSTQHLQNSSLSAGNLTPPQTVGLLDISQMYDPALSKFYHAMDRWWCASTDLCSSASGCLLAVAAESSMDWGGGAAWETSPCRAWEHPHQSAPSALWLSGDPSHPTAHTNVRTSTPPSPLLLLLPHPRRPDTPFPPTIVQSLTARPPSTCRLYPTCTGEVGRIQLCNYTHAHVHQTVQTEHLRAP